MALRIETFSNVKGGNAFYKAVSHPLAASPAAALVETLRRAGPVALYDPLGMAGAFAEMHDIAGVDFACALVQDVAAIGSDVLGMKARPVTDLPGCKVGAVFVAAFDADRLIDHIRHLIPAGAPVTSLDAMRIDQTLLTNKRAYLDPVNFATNFAFFRDDGATRTRVVTANYWTGYGAEDVTLHLVLFGGDGAILAEWDQRLGGAQSGVAIDSRDVRDRFGVGGFCGQLFIHASGIRGHDVVKYALDVWRDDGSMLSCTHDANAWPSDLYGGLPAPKDGEDVVLWLQNSHPCPIPAGEIALNLMGESRAVALDEEIAPFATRALSVASLLPEARWPRHIELRAGKHFVRPRYEIADAQGRQRMAHVNVERADLNPDPAIAEMGNLMGKGFILPAPVLPPERWRSIALPTPMATCQNELPLAALLIDSTGREVARKALGRLPRDHGIAVDAGELVNGSGPLAGGYGHIELIYDFSDGGAADGWLHAIFRYEDRHTGHAAETSFGAHVFNTVMTWKNEPQSYAGRAPGLSTRLFLRLGPEPLDTLCHLIYPASSPWHETSSTRLALMDAAGREVAGRDIGIPCGGSHLWRYSETFDAAERRAAGDGGYVIVRDTTCRLFGYHGLLNGDGPFSLDHMFGF
ncbi:MAG: hypothetical protein GEU92_11745 [Alphaproteobacteria bacterium]|nr:hypothetical protein [Alphaproteobacteria bacterium]